MATKRRTLLKTWLQLFRTTEEVVGENGKKEVKDKRKTRLAIRLFISHKAAPFPRKM